MNPDVVFEQEVQDFLQNNIHEDLATLALKTQRNRNVSLGFLLDQLAIRKKGMQKLPFCLANPYFVFPSKLSYEQCSSEITAAYKSTLLQGESLLDMTGGIGIDDLFFAKTFNQVIHAEQNETTSRFAAHNFTVLGIKNIQCKTGNGEDFLTQKYDAIYLDPARRKEDQKIFKFEDCSPNPMLLLEKLQHCASQLLIKASPLIEIKTAIQQLKHVQEVHIVSVKDEVREILFLLHTEIEATAPRIVAIDLEKNHQFTFTYTQEENSEVALSTQLGLYLYEPMSALYKAGAYKLISQQFALEKLSKNTHLYTSNELLQHFPGNVYEIEAIYPFNKKAQKSCPAKANTKTRNFKLSTAELKKYLKIHDGGDQYIIGTTFQNASILIVAKKVVA